MTFEKIMEFISNNRSQFMVLSGISLTVIGLVLILDLIDKQVFQRFLGRFNPLIVFLVVVVCGFIFLYFLSSHKWFTIYTRESLKAVFPYLGIAVLLAAVMAIADTKIMFPADTNVLFPKSLLFYPAIGFLAEIAFHIIPLSILVALSIPLFKQANPSALIWILIFIVSLVEPVYQASFMVSSGRYPLWAVLYVGAHIYIISLIQLIIFKKFDFTSMYAFRLVYYLFWHIIWGILRLKLLF
jgi:hypothetical protein